MNTQQRIENLHKEIEKLKRAMADTDVPFTIEAITEEIDEREQEITKLLDKQILEEEEYPEGNSFIDMSGATNNGDR